MARLVLKFSKSSEYDINKQKHKQIIRTDSLGISD